MVAPSIWFTRLSESTIAPQSNAVTSSRHVDRPIVDGDLGARRDVGTLLDAAGDAEPGSFVPARSFGRRAEDVGEALVLEVPQPQLDRIGAETVRKLVEVRLAGEVVGGGADPAVRTLAQRRLSRLKHELLVGDRVGAADPRRAGADVQEVPSARACRRSPHRCGCR